MAQTLITVLALVLLFIGLPVLILWIKGSTKHCPEAARSAEADTVYLTHHDGGDTAVFAESVTQVIRALKEANPDT